jgi:T5SS/PEP-CTERM-associated repeat protein
MSDFPPDVGQGLTIDGPSASLADGTPVNSTNTYDGRPAFTFSEIDIPGGEGTDGFGDGEGSVLVENMGVLYVDGTTYVGDTSNTGGGTLNIEQGGLVNTGALDIGSPGGSSGDVLVTGSNSSLTVRDDAAFYLGAGEQTFAVEAGATVTIEGSLLPASDDNDITTIDGIGSDLTVDNEIALGQGTMVVSGGGQVTAWGPSARQGP